MPKEKRNIVIRASQAVDGMVELAVIDRGTGIPPEQLPHLFEPFFTTKTAGIGMGLAIAKTIIEMHGGNITVENNPQGGATVRFTIMPVQAEEA
jgi:signal transduction histidine kinase